MMDFAFNSIKIIIKIKIYNEKLQKSASKEKYGIVTVKKFISNSKSYKTTMQIMKLIEQNFMNLAVGQYANYLIQFLLEKWNNTPEGNEIKKLIFDNFEKLMKKKYSSFICETYIKMISSEEKKILINTLNIYKIYEPNNHHSLKILKKLGININSNNNCIPNNLKNNNISNHSYFTPNNNINTQCNFMPNNNNINIQGNFMPNNNINIQGNLMPNNNNINIQGNLMPNNNNINTQGNLMPYYNMNNQINSRPNNNLINQGNSISDINSNYNNQNNMFLAPYFRNNFYRSKK